MSEGKQLVRISSGSEAVPWCVHSLLPTTDIKGSPDGPQVPGASVLAEVTGPLFSPNNLSLALHGCRVTAHLPPFLFNRISRDFTGLWASGRQGSQTGYLPQLEGLQGRTEKNQHGWSECPPHTAAPLRAPPLPGSRAGPGKLGGGHQAPGRIKLTFPSTRILQFCFHGDF